MTDELPTISSRQLKLNEIIQKVSQLQQEAKELLNSREISLAQTKLDEARMWLKEVRL